MAMAIMMPDDDAECLERRESCEHAHQKVNVGPKRENSGTAPIVHQRESGRKQTSFSQ